VSAAHLAVAGATGRPRAGPAAAELALRHVGRSGGGALTRVAGGGLEIKVELGVCMSELLFEASYTLDGVRGVQSAGGTSRRDAVAQVAESVGDNLRAF
jgi:hypothetical protein